MQKIFNLRIGSNSIAVLFSISIIINLFIGSFIVGLVLDPASLEDNVHILLFMVALILIVVQLPALYTFLISKTACDDAVARLMVFVISTTIFIAMTHMPEMSSTVFFVAWLRSIKVGFDSFIAIKSRGEG